MLLQTHVQLLASPSPSVPNLLESTWLLTHAVLPAVRVQEHAAIRAAIAAADVQPRLLQTRLSPAFPGALTPPQVPMGQQGSRLRHHVVSECKQTCHTHTCLAGSRIVLIIPGTVTKTTEKKEEKKRKRGPTGVPLPEGPQIVLTQELSKEIVTKLSPKKKKLSP